MSSCSEILPHGYLLARGVNYMLMFATSDSSVLILIGGVFSGIPMCVTLAGNESQPAVADEDKGPDRF